MNKLYKFLVINDGKEIGNIWAESFTFATVIAHERYDDYSYLYPTSDYYYDPELTWKNYYVD